MFYLIGIGLNDEQDITLKGLEKIMKCKKVYLENYTSKLRCKKEDLERLYEKKVKLANRKLVEDGVRILREAKVENVALLVIGDVFSATTHMDLWERAKKEGIKVEVIHNASVLNAVGITGLSLYKFGKTTSIPFENEKIKTPYGIIKKNKKMGAHTLVLLDLNPKKNKYMNARNAIKYLLKGPIKMKDKIIVCEQLGGENGVHYGNVEDLLQKKFIHYPQCIIVPSKLHFKEEEFLGQWK